MKRKTVDRFDIPDGMGPNTPADRKPGLQSLDLEQGFGLDVMTHILKVPKAFILQYSLDESTYPLSSRRPGARPQDSSAAGFPGHSDRMHAYSDHENGSRMDS